VVFNSGCLANQTHTTRNLSPHSPPPPAQNYITRNTSYDSWNTVCHSHTLHLRGGTRSGIQIQPNSR
jgi:hypothetical protein